MSSLNSISRKRSQCKRSCVLVSDRCRYLNIVCSALPSQIIGIGLQCQERTSLFLSALEAGDHERCQSFTLVKLKIEIPVLIIGCHIDYLLASVFWFNRRTSNRYRFLRICNSADIAKR